MTVRLLMDNHFHLLARTPRANLSRFMQRLSTSYALYARYKHGKPGHQFEARFKAKVVEEDTYLLAVTRYIHLNPIKIAACRRMSKAERVQRRYILRDAARKIERIDPEDASKEAARLVKESMLEAAFLQAFAPEAAVAETAAPEAEERAAGDA